MQELPILDGFLINPRSLFTMMQCDFIISTYCRSHALSQLGTNLVQNIIDRWSLVDTPGLEMIFIGIYLDNTNYYVLGQQTKNNVSY